MLLPSSSVLCVLLPLIRAAVIEKASVHETAKEYYDRIKTIPVDCISQEIGDAKKSDLQNVKQLLLANPLLRNLAMFSNKFFKEEQNNSEGKPPLKLFPKKSHRTTYSLSDNNFDEDYVRNNETFFQDVDAKNMEIRRQPTGRPLSVDGKWETFTSGISNEDDDNDQPFAVTESLIKSLESADNEVTMPIRTEKVSTPVSDQYAKHPANTFMESTDGTYLSSTLRPTTTSTFDNELTSVPSVPAHKIQDSIFSGFPESSTPTHEVPTAKKKKKKNDTVYGLNKSEFQGYLYLSEVGDPTNEWTGELSNDNFPESVVSFDQGSAVEKHSDTSDDLHVEDVVVAPRENGGYVVSGTRYYVDNRVNGDVRGKPDVMRDEYRLRSASKEYSEMIKDPRFAVEVELSKMMKRRSRRRFLQKGTKTQRFEESGKKTQKQRNFFDPEPPSVAWMMQKGGRLFEKRSTNIGGKLVTVEIGNKNLHGVDLIVRPGSIVHEAMPVKQDMNAIQKRMISNKNGISNMDGEALSSSNDYIKDTNLLETRTVPKETILEGDTQSVNACFQRQPDAHLSGFPAFKTAVGFTEIECLALCARVECRALNYASSISTCEIFDTIKATSVHVKQRLGYTYYKPNQKELKSCLSDILSVPKEGWLPEMDPDLRCTSIGICSTPTELRVVESRVNPTFHRLLSSRAVCSSDSAVLFIRSVGAHNNNELGSKLDTMHTSEDDCLFSCLRNKGIDMRPTLCASIEYDNELGRCTLAAEPRKNGLSSNPHTIFYEKICVSTAVANQCSGAAIERKADVTILGFLKDASTTASPEECIEKCVMAERDMGFQCLSIMYYYDETLLNCILNDGSAKTNPESIAKEDKSIVDYFGVDDCYGMPEVEDTRPRFLRNMPLTIEDDIVQRELTPGSLLEVLRRERSSPNSSLR